MVCVHKSSLISRYNRKKTPKLITKPGSVFRGCTKHRQQQIMDILSSHILEALFANASNPKLLYSNRSDYYSHGAKCPPFKRPAQNELASMELVTGLWSLLISVLGIFGNGSTIAACLYARKKKRSTEGLP